jgi:excisionase family DNA binding protein
MMDLDTGKRREGADFTATLQEMKPRSSRQPDENRVGHEAHQSLGRSPGDGVRRGRTGAQPSSQPRLLSTTDVAEFLSISRRTLERMLSAGEFPAPDKRIGRMSRWRPETVDNWIENTGGGR